MAGDQCVNGVPLKEYVELLVDAKTNELKVLLAERLEAVHTAYERHEGEHAVIKGEMEHLNQLRQDVLVDRARFVLIETFNTYRDSMSSWVNLMGTQLSSLRGQIVGAGAVLTLVFAAAQIAIAFYR